MVKLIVTQGISELLGESDRPIDHMEHNIISWLTSLEFKVFPAPNNLEQLTPSWFAALKPHGVVLSGGNDLGSSKLRDKSEKVIFEYALENRLPVLGICRGMQFIVKYFGGKIIKSHSHVGVRHEVKGAINKNVNSFHNYVIKNVSEDLQVLARSPEGSIEAIKHKFLPVHGWMWHTERDAVYCKKDNQNVKRIFG